MISCACGTSFSISHVFSSPIGGFPSIRHNEIRDLTVGFLTEVCNDVKIELELQPTSGEALSRTTSNNADSARLDIAVNGFWGERHERTSQDKRVFNPHASSNRTSSSCVKHEKEREFKNSKYERQSTFHLLQLSCQQQEVWSNKPQHSTKY